MTNTLQLTTGTLLGSVQASIHPSRPAYLLQNWPLNLFTDTELLTVDQQIYNMKICRALVVTENVFGR